MYVIFAICILIILIVLLLSVLTTSKAYKYEHTIDPLQKEEKPQKKEDITNGKDA